MHRFFPLLLLFGLLVAPGTDGRVLAEEPATRRFVGPYRLETRPVRRVRGRIEGRIEAPHLAGKRWWLFAPVPPETDGQDVRAWDFALDVEKAERARVVAEDVADQSPLARPLRRLSWRPRKAASAVRYRYEVEAVLNAIRLVPGEPKHPVEALSKAERRRYLRADDRYDFESETFRAWRDEHGLARAKGERDLDYAWRVLAHIHGAYGYRFPTGHRRTASIVCRVDASDCGGLSLLFASLLRAHGVPARLLVGRWALPDKGDDPQFHVRAEFWAEGVGWVPIDGSGAVTWKGAPASAFGIHRAKFLTLHLEPGLEVDTVRFGVQPITWMQSPVFWVQGSGRLEPYRHERTWTVEELPLDG